MPRVIISFQTDITDDEMNKAINDIKANGGTIKDDYRPLMKAVAADIPESYTGRLTDDKLVKNIELDSVVTTQAM
ncbi:hypothetical protein AGABI1DRAFT_112654 [Agaricus bisporus var. burnettii JB137-S8]|uniref:Inhibitor I9 domain-containing protein n=1 Tax=Agaricus bisporus var. burnettii (strain JB137-S8 / ATCC MYA-4627 / FGSC 10392) TaxID=597362 RepID=K5WZI2_AGABU|nr:uncharacterized protein AGABI1DRAFT_112654 [Agaricus bisporus var. burnettii JB137-S8]EKM80946.1 hypothetical protein AGABI1DRAFT_112654 [Agaricus bisporus var. burnettii JB137-S8]